MPFNITLGHFSTVNVFHFSLWIEESLDQVSEQGALRTPRFQLGVLTVVYSGRPGAINPSLELTSAVFWGIFLPKGCWELCALDVSCRNFGYSIEPKKMELYRSLLSRARTNRRKGEAI